jgi:hypothetical protein
MKKSIIFFSIFVVLFLQSNCALKPDLRTFLKGIPGVIVEEIDDNDSTRESYKILIRQKVDHFGSDTVTFLQKIYLSHIDFSKPVVIVTEGYTANRNYISELANVLNANQIIVEHRYFGESVPDSLRWIYLNIKQAAEDHHLITEIFREIYKEKWVSTGISKGGQTALYYKYFYPNDVDACVPYVAPINFNKEEPRVFKFLSRVGTDTCRQKITNFQKLLLQNKEKLLPEFEQYANDNKLTFKMGTEAAFEYCVLEFSFAFWQWGDLPCDSIPLNPKDTDKLFGAFEKVGFSFFSNEDIESIRPFYYQALTEIGFYTYDIKPFAGLIKSVSHPNFYFTLPEGVDTTYNSKSMRDVNEFLQNRGNNIIYIYGQNDPWSASAVQLIPGKTNALKMVKEGGNHKTRIKSFNQEEKELIYRKLEEWLEYKIDTK